MPHPPHNAVETSGGDALVQLLRIARAALLITGKNEADALHAALFQRFGRVDQHALTLPRGQPRRQQNNPLVRLHAPGAPQGLHPGGRHLIGLEGAQIRAAMDDDDALAREGVHFNDAVARKFRIGDHDIAARHDRIILHFQRARTCIGAVIGRHERHARASGCA